MPRRSRRRSRSEKRQEAFETLAIILFATAEDSDDELVAVSIALFALNVRRDHTSLKYGPRGPYNAAKCDEFYENLLHDFTERQFKRWIRVDRDTFWHLHSFIKDDPVFQSNGNKPQRPSEHQLAAFLCRAGAEDALKDAAVMAIAEGTVFDYGRRVVHAFRNIRSEHLAWPGNERRNFLKDEMGKLGFPGCIGIADGTLIKLVDKPYNDGEAFFCRKKFYALAMLAVCDHRGIFTAYELGWPGSVNDVTMFKESRIWQEIVRFFNRDEYILVDKGFPLTKYTIRPFGDIELTTDEITADERKIWNQELSSVRVAVENAFGRLKGRFPCLRNFAVRDLEQAYRIIEALLVIHNIIEELGDDPTDIAGYNGIEDETIVAMVDRQDEDPSNEDELHRGGVRRRKRLVEEWRQK